MNKFSFVNNFSSLRVAVIGDLMADIFSYGEVTRVSPEGPHVIFKDTGESVCVPGGAGNVWSNVVALGASCDMYTLYAPHESMPLPPGILDCGPCAPPIVKQRLVDKNGQAVIRIDREKIHKTIAKPSWVDTINRNGYDAIIFADYGKGTCASVSVDMFDPPCFVDCHPNADVEMYRGAMVLKPNEKEMMSLWGGTDALNDARSLLHSDGALVITRAEKSVQVFHHDEFFEVVPSPIDVCDVTGAGDTFISAYCLACVSGAGVKASTEIATMASEIAVSVHGTHAVTSRELLTRMLKRGVGRVMRRATFQEIKDHFHPYVTYDITAGPPADVKDNEVLFAMVPSNASGIASAFDHMEKIDFIVLDE